MAADLKDIEKQVAQAAEEVVSAGKLKEGDLFVVGCSSSEILGDKIGTATNVDIAEAVYAGLMSVLQPKGIYLAAQCCEHLNRALVVERAVQEKWDLELVNAIPQPNHAGGALGTVAFEKLPDAVLVENVDARASAGMDIGGTLIGMHIQPVVVPLRISTDHIGEAPLICARRRPKYVGGPRAIYDESLM